MKRGSFLLPFGKRGNLHLPFVFPLNPFSTLTRRQRVLPKAARFIYNPHPRVLGGAIARDDGEFWARTQPRGHRVGRAIGEQVDRPAALQVHDDGAVDAAFAQGKVVDADDGGCRGHGCRTRAQEAEQRVRARAQAQADGQPGAGLAAGGEADVAQRLRQRWGAPGAVGHEGGQALGEGALGTGRHVAEEAAHAQQQAHGPIHDGQVMHESEVATVHPRGRLSADGARRAGLSRVGVDEQRGVNAPHGVDAAAG